MEPNHGGDLVYIFSRGSLSEMKERKSTSPTGPEINEESGGKRDEMQAANIQTLFVMTLKASGEITMHKSKLHVSNR